MLRKLLKAMTQRLFWFVVFMAIQFGLLLCAVLWASYAKGFYLAFSILSILMLFVVFTRPEKPAYKMVWMFLIGILPVFGGVLYMIMANKKLGYFSRKKMKRQMRLFLRKFLSTAIFQGISITPQGFLPGKERSAHISITARNSSMMSCLK